MGIGNILFTFLKQYTFVFSLKRGSVTCQKYKSMLRLQTKSPVAGSFVPANLRLLKYYGIFAKRFMFNDFEKVAMLISRLQWNFYHLSHFNFIFAEGFSVGKLQYSSHLFQYHWADGNQVKKPIKCSAPKYIDFLMTWVQVGGPPPRASCAIPRPLFVRHSASGRNYFIFAVTFLAVYVTFLGCSRSRPN